MPANLVFHHLILNNFRSFTGKHRIDFTAKTGLCYVSGSNKLEEDLSSNGAGKSTLFDALIWCLSGRTLRTARPGAMVEPWGTKDTVRAEVAFERAEQIFTVTRTRKPNVLTLNDKIVEQPEIYKALGMSYDALVHTIIIGQFNEMFLDLKPEPASALFTELLSLDIWLDSAERATKKSRGLESALTDVNTLISRQEGQESETKEQIKTLEYKGEEYEEQRKTALEHLAISLTEATTNLEQVRERFGEPLTSESLEAGVRQRAEAMAALRASQRVIQKKISDKEAESTRDDTKISLLKATREKYLQVDDPTCPECGQVVEQSHLKDKAENLRIGIKKLSARYNQSIDILEGYDKELDVINKEIGDLQAQTDTIQQQLSSIIKKQEESNQAIGEAKTAISTIKAAVEGWKSAANPHTDMLKLTKVRLDETIKYMIASKEKQAKLQTEIGTLKFWGDSFKEIRLNLIDETLQELEVAVNRHAEELGLHGWEIKFATERETVKGDIRYSFTTLLFPPGQDNPISWESYSGGESTRWQLACTFGLSEVLLARAGLTSNIMVIDEPTRHLSDTGVDSLLTYLKERTVERQETVFFIDHQLLDSGYFDHQLLIEKTKTGSRLEWL